MKKNSYLHRWLYQAQSVLVMTGLLVGSGVSVNLSEASQSPLSGGSSADVDYGQMYVLQKKGSPEHPFEANVAYSYGFSNPYLGMHGFNLGLGAQVSEFFIIGASAQYYATTTKDVVQGISSQLQSQGIASYVYRPTHGFYGNFTVLPLAGLLNWFNTKAYSFDLGFSLGGGVIHYESMGGFRPSLSLAVLPKLMLNEHFGVGMGLNTYFDFLKGGDVQNRMEASIGGIARF